MGRSPEIIRPVNEGRALRLVNSAGIRFEDRRYSLEDLQELGQAAVRNRNGRWTFDLVNVEDKVIFLELVHSCIPLVVIGNVNDSPLVLDAEIARFPYSTKGPYDKQPREGFQKFGMRLIPEEGSIDKVIFNAGGNVVVIDRADITEELIDLDLRYGELHLELYLGKVDKEKLPPLTPHGKFEKIATWT